MTISADYIIKIIIQEIINIENSWWLTDQNLTENRIEYGRLRELLKSLAAENKELKGIVKESIRALYVDGAEKRAIEITGPAVSEPEEV